MPLKVPTITDLDVTQREVVKYQPYDAPMFVNGPPGSGKTHVAILRMQVLLNNGYTNVLFLLYNHSMYGFLRTIFNKMGLSTNVEINTKDIFLFDLAKKNGYRSNSYGDDYNTEYNKRLQFLLTCDSFDRYDVIVIDECQDFSDTEITVLKKMSEKVIAVGDYDQTIYQNSPSSYFRQLPSHKLNTIYRFGRKIAQIAQPFSKSRESLTDRVNIVNDTDVFRVKAGSDSDAFQKIARIVEAKRYTNQTICILAPTNSQLRTLQSGLLANNVNCFFAQANKEFRNYNFDTRQPVLITPFSSKGMEFDVVILFGYKAAQFNFNLASKKNEIIYVSLTRTSNELYLIQQPDTDSMLANLSGWVDIDTASSKDTSRGIVGF